MTKTKLREKGFWSSANFLGTRISDFIGSRLFLQLTLWWFFFQTALIALSVKTGLPPDEAWHLGYIKLYARELPDIFIDNQEGFYYLGDITRSPNFVYHYLLSFVYKISFFKEGITITILRFVNIGMALTTLGYLYKLAMALKLSRAAANIAVFALSNTLMFVFLSATVNYDNLTILLASISFYLTIIIMQKADLTKLLLLGIVMVLGALTKFTFLPLMLLLGIAIFIRYLPSLKTLTKIAKVQKNKFAQRTLFYILLLSALIILFSSTYLTNLLVYKQIAPTCNKVHTEEKCLQNHVYKRNIMYLSRDAIPNMSLVEFVAKWGYSTVRSTLGVRAHKSTEPSSLAYIGWSIISLLIIFSILKDHKVRDKSNYYVLVVSILYVATVALVNWRTYERYGIFEVGLHGRYIFPVITVVYATGFYYFWRIMGKRQAIRGFVTALLLLLLLIGSLPTFIAKTSSQWYRSQSADYIQQIKRLVPDL